MNINTEQGCYYNGKIISSGYQLGDKGLLVKVDGNAQNIIEQWKKRSGIKQDSDGMDVLSTQVIRQSYIP